MHKKPIVTVYVPTKDRFLLLKRALDSVLNQTYQDLELIVVDDGSSDDTWQFLQALSASDARVKCYRNEKSIGAPASRNKAIFEAAGEFITGLDDDDFFLEDRIEKFMLAWERFNSEVIALYSDHSAINTFGELKTYQRPKKANLKRQYLKNSIGNQVFTKTRTFRDLGGFDVNLEIWQDYELWLRLLRKGQVAKVPVNTYVFDHSHDSQRISNTKNEKVSRAFEYIVNKHSISGKDLARFELFSTSYLNNLGLNNLINLLRFFDLEGLYCFTKFCAKNILKNNLFK